MKFTDDYDFETLTVPAIVTGFPVAVVLAAFGFSINAYIGITILGVELLTFLLVPSSALIRNSGKRIESKLFGDELPTTFKLRAQQSGKDKVGQRRRELVEKLSRVKLEAYAKAKYDRNEEKNTINHAISVVRERMRGKDFSLLRRELKSYGYWRNMYGIKPFAIIVVGACIILYDFSFILIPPDALFGWIVRLAGLLAIVCLLLFWCFLVRQKNVIDAADNYSEQFFKSLVVLDK